MFNETVIQAIRRNDWQEVKKFIVNVNDADEDGWNLLHYAAKFGSLEVMESLIKEGVDINVKANNGNNLLHIAADFGRENIVKFFLDKPQYGLSVNDQGKDNWTPLHYAANKGYLGIVKFLVETKNATIDARTDDSTPLHYAAANGHLPVVKFLIEKGASINLELANEVGYTEVVKLLRNELLLAAVRQKDQAGVETQINGGANINYARQGGWTPLHYAVNHSPEDPNFVKFLVKKDGIDINARNSDGDKPLHIASNNGYNSIVNFFLDDKGLSVNDQGKDNWTPIHYAANKAYLGLGEALVKREGIDVNARDRNGQTPLHHAASKGHVSFVRLLVKKGVNINAENSDSKTPLQLANDLEVKKILLGEALINAVRANNMIEVKKYINTNEIDVNYSRDDNKWTPLHYAASLGYRRSAEMLIKSNNATVDAKDFENNTPLHIAVDYDKENIVGLLLDNKANIGSRGRNASTPLHYAADKGHFRVAELLVEKGAKINEINSDNESPLQLARDNNHQIIVKLLLNKLLLNAVNAMDEFDIGKVKEYLKEGAEINYLGHHGWTPLHHAANRTSETLGLIRLLVKEGADVNATAYSGDKPLHTASSHTHINVVKFFIEEKGLDVNDRGEENLTPLHHAVKKGSKVFVKFLIKKEADIYAENSNSTTPLDIAKQLASSESNRKEIRDILLGKALIDAVKQDDRSKVKNLISEKADVEYSYEDRRWRPLHYAAGLGYQMVAEVLIRSNATVIGAKDRDGSNPMHIAAKYGHKNIVELFLKDPRKHLGEDEAKLIECREKINGHHSTMLLKKAILELYSFLYRKEQISMRKILKENCQLI